MPECSTCGNPIEAGTAICPFCQRPSGRAGGVPVKERGDGLKVVNIKVGLPTVAEARDRLEREVATARQAGVKVLKVVHGYGSGGAGGGIGRMARAVAQELRSRGLVRLVVPGEDFNRNSVAGRQLLGSFPWLAGDRDCGRSNRGVTILTLK